MESTTAIRVTLYTQQPFVGKGVAALMETRPDFELVACLDDLTSTIAQIKTDPPDVTLAYLTTGLSLADLRELRSANTRTPIVLWSQEMPGEFVFQAMQLGIRGLLPDETPPQDLLTALHRVHDGELCFETEILETLVLQKRVILTTRESQIVALVAQGLKNKEISYQLHLSEGTVKVYLSRIFRKLDMNDRLDLALYGLKNLFGGQAGMERAAEQRANSPELACPVSLPLRTRTQANARFPN